MIFRMSKKRALQEIGYGLILGGLLILLLGGLGFLSGCVAPDHPAYDEYWLMPDAMYLEYNGAAQDTRWGGQAQRGSIHGGTVGFTWSITKPNARGR